MRIAALYDIHGNLPALEAVLADVRDAGAELVVVGGDVLPGPMPRESLECLVGLDIPVRFIRGNGDRAVLERMAGTEAAALPDQVREIIRWNAGELDSRQQRILAGWPLTVRVDVTGLGDVLFCHATPRDDNEIFTRLTAEARLRPIFDAAAASLVICGHTHMQFDRMIGRTRVLNAGSVGMPFGEPGACWLLLGPGAEMRRTTYDLAIAADRIRATRYPHADDFAAQHVLQVPQESVMLDAFTRGELTP